MINANKIKPLLVTTNIFNNNDNDYTKINSEKLNFLKNIFNKANNNNVGYWFLYYKSDDQSRFIAINRENFDMYILEKESIDMRKGHDVENNASYAIKKYSAPDLSLKKPVVQQISMFHKLEQSLYINSYIDYFNDPHLLSNDTLSLNKLLTDFVTDAYSGKSEHPHRNVNLLNEYISLLHKIELDIDIPIIKNKKLKIKKI